VRICSTQPAARFSSRVSLGRAQPPAFLHHELLMKTATQKLSKSDGDTGVRDLRAQGMERGGGD
jgi:glutamyl/glutaminyl-tRNA synthetase